MDPGSLATPRGHAPRRATTAAVRWPFGLLRRGPLLRTGMLALGVGALLDAGHHAGVAPLAGGHIAEAGHLVTLTGMAVTAFAVAIVGLRRR